MKDFWNRAKELMPVMVKDRRYIHEHAEAGMELPDTTAYVTKRLKELGLEPKRICGSGIEAVIEGEKPGKTLLLRADMDALPMPEENTLPYRSKTKAAHTCGHDMHTAMLLAAAQMLTEEKSDLCGRVKLMFQPGEEIFAGSAAMMEAGILKAPDVDAAMGIHMMLDAGPGTICYGEGFMTSSCDGFEITIQGKGCHGAMPHTGVDPIQVGVHIYQAFQELIARETPPMESAVLTFGEFCAGSTANIIPDTAVLKGTLRTYNKELRSSLVKRMKEIVQLVAMTFRAEAKMETLSSVPPTYTNPAMLEEMLEYIENMIPNIGKIANYKVTPSDDFAFISEQVPTMYLMLCGKTEGNPYQHHNPGVVFNEDAMPFGAAIHAQCAMNWLSNHC